jgi:hypothetical protein
VYTVCTPDAPVAGALTVVHFCQPPVSGTCTVAISGACGAVEVQFERARSGRGAGQPHVNRRDARAEVDLLEHGVVAVIGKPQVEAGERVGAGLRLQTRDGREAGRADFGVRVGGVAAARRARPCERRAGHARQGVAERARSRADLERAAVARLVVDDDRLRAVRVEKARADDARGVAGEDAARIGEDEAAEVAQRVELDRVGHLAVGVHGDERRAGAAAARMRAAVVVERDPPFHEGAARAAHHVDDLLEVLLHLVGHPRAARVLGLVVAALREGIVEREHRARAAAVAVPRGAGHRAARPR